MANVGNRQPPDEGRDMTPDEWHDLVKGMLRAEMTRRGITYGQLAAKLPKSG
jgi:hypothetical protein